MDTCLINIRIILIEIVWCKIFIHEKMTENKNKISNR